MADSNDFDAGREFSLANTLLNLSLESLGYPVTSNIVLVLTSKPGRDKPSGIGEPVLALIRFGTPKNDCNFGNISRPVTGAQLPDAEKQFGLFFLFS
ncbi:hypothetical protein D3C84_1093430 [compost metagenome]